MEWRNVTETFTEEQRHYNGTYLEICEVYDEKLEVSLFSAEDKPYEIYVSFGRMYGIVYASQEVAAVLREDIKQVLLEEYEQHEEPTSEFIDEFAECFGLCMPNDVLFDASGLLDF